MKKIIIFLTSLLLIFALASCKNDTTTKDNNNENMYSLPDLYNKTLVEAIVLTNGNIELSPNYIESNKVLPDRIISYSEKEVGNKVEVGSTVKIDIAKIPSNAVTHSDRVLYVSEVSALTGPKSKENDAFLESHSINRTDLGFPVELPDKRMAFIFGDSYSARPESRWISNFIAFTDDNDYSDGLTFNDILTDDTGKAIAFYEGEHTKGNETDNTVENTKIPTGVITIGNTTYIYYMSIRYWGEAGMWKVNYCSAVKTTDMKTFTPLDNLKWTEEEAPNFGQISPMKDINSDYVYIYGIPGGRSGGGMTGRVKESDIEDFSKYEYQVSKGVWVKGSEGLRMLKANEYYTIIPRVAELTACFNPYLNKYMMIFYRNGSLVMVTSDTPDGVYGDAVALLNQTDYNGIYGGLISSAMLRDNGKSFYMTVSCWEDYNVFLVKVVLK